MSKKGKFNIEIFKSWCKKCGICVAFCPVEALGQDETGTPFVKNPEKCTGCQMCELRCPDFAITLRSPRKKKEEKEKNIVGEEVAHE